MTDDVLGELTPQEQQELQQYLVGPQVPLPEEKHNVHKFLHEVSISDDTTKTGNLEIEELGLPKLPVRTNKELALFCREIADMSYFADYFIKEAEITTSTSLSKDAKLLNTAVITRRELADVSKKSSSTKKRTGWFKKKGVEE